MTAAARAARGLAIAILPALAGLWVTASTFGGTLVPWRPLMVDLDVYRRAGLLLLQGGNIYDLPGQLPFLYPPFAALLAVPLALLPATLVQIGWTLAGVLSILAVLYRFGLTGWVLSLVGTVTVVFVEPVSETLAFGQLGIFLVALVFLDLAPGPRVLGPHRLLPEGVLTALATAIKLTPGIFLLYLIAAGKRRAALVTIATGLAVTLVSAAFAPAASLTFWGRLAHGDTGLGHSIIYYTNQSVMADVVRIFGLGREVALVGLALSAVAAAVGVWAAVRWHQLGEVRLAVSICGVAGLLASPVSWLHHFVWVVPLAMCLLEGTVLSPGRAGVPDPQRPPLPTWFRVLGWLFVGWVIVSPFRRLPNGADVELDWTWSQHALASVTAVLGLALVVSSIGVARRLRTLSPAPQG
ncbi:MAG: glycosyltransferase 87 family protein [Propionibacteriaceae bacterium]